MTTSEGMVLHPERHALHGITVIIGTPGSVTYIGRFDVEDERGVHLINVAIHDAESDGPAEDFIAQSRRFGVRVTRKHLVVPREDIKTILRLGAA
jgi:hypothetical protein